MTINRVKRVDYSLGHVCIEIDGDGDDDSDDDDDD